MAGVPENNGSISDSWVDLSGQLGTTTPPLVVPSASPLRVTPLPFGGDYDYLRMLREAQRESNRASAKVSPISSALMSLSSTPKKISPCASPKSPPNSPNHELATFAEELRGIYINRVREHSGCGGGTHKGASGDMTTSDIIWDWSSRPNIPHKDWRVSQTTTTGPAARSRKASSSSSKVDNRGGPFKGSGVSGGPGSSSGSGKKSRFSKEMVYTLVITNLLSFLIGAGIGIWLSKRGRLDCSSCGALIEIAI